MKKLVLLVIAVSVLFAGIPSTITFKGTLEDCNDNKLSDTYNIMFRIFDTEYGGVQFWSEAHNSVKILNDIFEVDLGTKSEFNPKIDDTYWIELTIDGKTVSPRHQIKDVIAGNTLKSVFCINPGAPESAFSISTDIGDGNSDTVAVMNGKWGLFREGNIGYGNNCSTHINLGIQSETGKDGLNNSYITSIGGESNKVETIASSIVGGSNNSILSDGEAQREPGCSFIGGGNQNNINGSYSATLAGLQNSINGSNSSIISGKGNSIDGQHSFIPCGDSITINGNYSMGFGKNIEIDKNFNSQFYSDTNPGNLNVYGNLNIYRSGTKDSNSNLNLAYSSDAFYAYTGIKFKVDTDIGNNNYKAGIFYQRSDYYGLKNIVFAINGKDNSNNVDIKDAIMYINENKFVGILCPYPKHSIEVWGSAAKLGGGEWNNISDMNILDIQEDYTKGLNEIMQLQPKYYTYNNDNELGIECDDTFIGFTSQDVQKTFPEAVSANEDSKLLYHNNNAITMAMINAIKEQQKQIEELKSRIKELENK